MSEATFLPAKGDVVGRCVDDAGLVGPDDGILLGDVDDVGVVVVVVGVVVVVVVDVGVVVVVVDVGPAVGVGDVDVSELLAESELVVELLSPETVVVVVWESVLVVVVDVGVVTAGMVVVVVVEEISAVGVSDVVVVGANFGKTNTSMAVIWMPFGCSGLPEVMSDPVSQLTSKSGGAPAYSVYGSKVTWSQRPRFRS